MYILDHLVAETIRFKRLFLRKFAINVLMYNTLTQTV